MPCWAEAGNAPIKKATRAGRPFLITLSKFTDKICRSWVVLAEESRLMEEILNEGGKFVKYFLM